MELDASRVRLTDLASCGGCAAKYSAARLEQLLKGFVPVEAEHLLVGLAPADDPAADHIDEARAPLFPLGCFPPVVDGPGHNRAIAATTGHGGVCAVSGTRRPPC